MRLFKTPREIKKNTHRIIGDIDEVKIEIIDAKNKLDEILSIVTNQRTSAETSRYHIYKRLGFELLLDSSSLVDKTIIEEGHWEAGQVEFIRGLIERMNKGPDCFFLDIGAYWGLYSMIALQAGVPNIMAFEADKNNYAQFKTQQFLNDTTDHIKCYNLAVSDRKGTATFWDSKKHPDGNRAGVGIVGPSHNDDTYEVETVSIDDFLSLKDKMIIAKLDVEGNEPNVLSGMTKTILNNRVVLQVEMLPGLEGPTIKALEALDLRKIGEIHVDHYYTNLSAAEVGC
ncbi:MAG: FkbM family methyltransferase [Hyphomicrobiaceae bacterium]